MHKEIKMGLLMTMDRMLAMKENQINKQLLKFLKGKGFELDEVILFHDELNDSK